MYQFIRPKFKFGLFLQEHNKPNFQTNNSNAEQPTICYADSYEIKEDGSIIFYRSAKTTDETSEKRFKIPVLAYPNGKWDACVLMDDQNSLIVFNDENPVIGVQKSRNKNSDNNSKQPYNQVNSEQEEQSDDLDSLDSAFNSGSQNSSNHEISRNENPFGNQVASIPGNAVQNNGQELKKAKNEWLEKNIKEYTRNADFAYNDFMAYMQKDSQFKTYNPNETDIIWTASNLIRDKSVISRKFSDELTQKQLGLILPDIMRRQWNGKVTPILDILQEREETKNANAIDLAVWMVRNNFN